MNRQNIDKKIFLGRCAYNGKAKVNEVYVRIEYVEDRLSISADVWNRRKTDICIGGQCLDELPHLLPGDEKIERICAVWERWHLNDLRAGSPKQMECIRAHDKEWGRNKSAFGNSHYQWALALLNGKDLNPDNSYIHNGKPYVYGSAWLTEEIPDEVYEEVASW